MNHRARSYIFTDILKSVSCRHRREESEFSVAVESSAQDAVTWSDVDCELEREPEGVLDSGVCAEGDQELVLQAAQ